jgi:hypothetical protein
VRQLLDLARFLFPYGVLPRRWRSSLFEHNSGVPTRTVCSTMIAEAFHSVKFPVLPLPVDDEKMRTSLQERNSKLFTPRDFDYSLYFEIIKYLMFGFDELAVYRRLPWDANDAVDGVQETAVRHAGTPHDEPANHTVDPKASAETRV